ncbi:DUF2690 domain-containing protein [Streptomyces sp. NPDC005322]|uniref:helix-turn-helix domain-containing protein n=1 Tax=unclassified Streptomyces TaxID=2593676 RepID=UPI0033AF9EFE
MPRWRDLPEELDPQVREFAGRLRTVVERSGMSVVTVADRTGYSKSSWERYLNGRLLPPQGAVEALAEATGADVHHLTALWELAERSWCRSEMRHDVTVEALGVARARAVIEEFDPVAREVRASRNGRPSQKGRPGVELPGPERPLVAPPSMSAAVPSPDPVLSEPKPSAPLPSSSALPASSAPPLSGRRRAVLFVAGLVGALLLIAGAVLLINPDGERKRAERPATAPATSARRLPAGVKCAGADCTGKDPEAMGCGGASATTTADVTVGTAYVEVRYSRACGAAWARITRAAPGDLIRVTAPARGGAAARTQAGKAGADGDAYTGMVRVDSTSRATACATLADGRRGCTARGPGG